MIDTKIANLINDLNACGFVTEASCEGKRTLLQFDLDEHTHTAYIYFRHKLPQQVIERAKSIGLYVYGDDRGINSMFDFGWKQDQINHLLYIPCHTNDQKNDLIKANCDFEYKIRNAFKIGLTDENLHRI